MILVKEITDDWTGVTRSPNHTYLMDDKMEKIIGYFKWHNPNDFELSRSQIKLDRRYRKFKILQTGYVFANEKPQTKTWEIEGSKGNKYVVLQDELGYNCSCIGFKYHGKCKHIAKVTNESE
jgi:hypothetical protein